jgi:hypothetical protein
VVNIADDVSSELEKVTFKQWFYFRVTGVKMGKAVNFTIANAGKTTFNSAWPG